MAKPIESTPILKGKDAVRFNEKLNENRDKKISRESYDRIMQAGAMFNTILVKSR